MVTQQRASLCPPGHHRALLSIFRITRLKGKKERGLPFPASSTVCMEHS